MDDMKLSRSALVAITLMRIAVGWHFLYEGIAKLSSPTWSAAGYMRVSRGPFSAFFKWIASQPQLLDKANLATEYGLAVIGVLLILGLFTRLAALAGIALVLLFYLCNPPFVGYFYTIPSEGSYLIVNKNVVEIFALSVIAFTRTGLFAGLDRIVHGLFRRGVSPSRPALAQP